MTKPQRITSAMQEGRATLPANLVEQSMETHCLQIAGQCGRIPFSKGVIDLWSIADGMVTWITGEDGQDYEILVRPAQYAEFKDIYRQAKEKPADEATDMPKSNEVVTQPSRRRGGVATRVKPPEEVVTEPAIESQTGAEDFGLSALDKILALPHFAH